MNKRIQALVEQAKKSVPHGLTPDKWIEVYNEKFAELIVRECMDQIQVLSRDAQGEWCGDWNESDVLKHFGVEE